eukprot:5238502-Amphidinium_carterae.1
MGKQEDKQAYKLNKTLDGFIGTVNTCLSQLAIEIKKVDDKTGAKILVLEHPWRPVLPDTGTGAQFYAFQPDFTDAPGTYEEAKFASSNG